MADKLMIKPADKPIPGVKPAALKKIESMLVEGRRYFGSSGASLTRIAFDPAYEDEKIDKGAAKVGIAGERDTTSVLKRWMKDRPNAVLIDSVHIIGEEDVVDEETGEVDGPDTDHILVIGDEVILIDTKRWKSKRNYSVADNGEILRANKPFPGGKVRMRQAIHLWMAYLVEDNLTITGIVLINAEEVTVFRNRNWFVNAHRLVELDRLEEFLDMKWDAIDDYDKTHINVGLVAQIAANTVKPYDERARVFDMSKLSGFR